MKLKNRPLVTGAVTLFAAGIINRIIGTVYRVLLVRSVGEDVLGLYQLTLPVHRIAVTVATLGIPIAITRLWADAEGRNEITKALRIRKVGLGISVAISLFVAALLYFSSSFIANTILTDPRARLPVAIMGLVLIPSVISAALRGGLEGQGKMGPVALSTVVEASVRLPAVLIVVPLFLNKGLDWTVVGIKIGVIISETASLITLLIASRKSNKGNKPNKTRGIHFLLLDHIPIIKRLLKVGLPVSGSGFLNNTLSLITVAITPRRLAIVGLRVDEAVRAYGRLSGMAVPLLYIPMVAIYPIIRVLQPTVANLTAKSGIEAVKPLLRKSYTIAAGISLISAVMFIFFPNLLGSILYGINDLDSLIRPLAVATPFAYLGSITTGILYGLGHTGIVMTNSAIGNIVRLILVWTLAASWGIEGCMWAVIADIAISATLDMLCLAKILKRI